MKRISVAPGLLALLLVAVAARAEVVTYQAGGQAGGAQARALLCRPESHTARRGPLPASTAAVVYAHGFVVDKLGYEGARERGYAMDAICQALAKDGLLAFAPIRRAGWGNMPRHAEEVSAAVDYVKTLPGVDPSRVALMGFSRGGLLALMVGVARRDLKALLILAPAPGRGHFAAAVSSVDALNVPVLLLVEASDSPVILENFDHLLRALRMHGKIRRAIRYDRGGGHRLFWNVGYYWDDVRKFLRRALQGGSGR